MSISGLVSVLIPLFNHAEHVEACLDSLAGETYPNLEVIIIDDGSEDESHEVVEAWRERNPTVFSRFLLLQQENQGINRTLNRALAESHGEFIAIIASDDIRVGDEIKLQVAMLQASPEISVVYANGKHWFPEQQVCGPRVHTPHMVSLIRGAPAEMLDYLYVHIPALYIQACLFRKTLLLSIGAFDEGVTADDWVLNIRIFRSASGVNEIAYLDRDVFFYRHHATNIHSNLEGQLYRILEVANTYTPSHLRRRFRADIFNEFAWRALSRRRPLASLRYFVFSQRESFSPRRAAMLLLRILNKSIEKAQVSLQRITKPE